MSKVLFLDVDGVLNTSRSFTLAHTSNNIDSDCLWELKRVLDRTGTDIVLSSTWRVIPHARHDLYDWLQWSGLPTWIDVTPDFRVLPRGEEIACWLKKHLVQRYAIVDDWNDMLPEQQPYFVRTDEQFGLTRVDADKLIEVLNT